MRTLVLLFAALLPLAAQPLQQNDCAGTTVSTTFTCTLPSVSAGSTIVFAVESGNVTVTGIAVTGGSGGCAPTAILNAVGTNSRLMYGGACANATATASTITWTVTQSANSSSQPEANVSEWPAASFPATITVEGTAATTGNTTGTPTTPNLTPTAGDSALVIGLVRGNGTFGGTPSNSYQAMSTLNSGSQFAYLQVANSAGATNTGYSGWTSTSWTSGIFAIKMNAITSTHIRHSVKAGL